MWYYWYYIYIRYDDSIVCSIGYSHATQMPRPGLDHRSEPEPVCKDRIVKIGILGSWMCIKMTRIKWNDTKVIYIYYKVTKVTKVTKFTKVTKYQSIHPLDMFLPTLSPGFLCRKFSFSIMVDAAAWIPISVSVGKSGAQNLPAGSDTQLPFTVAHKCSFNLSGFSQNPKA